MKENEITWDIINSSYRGRGLFYKYCHLISCCEDCNKKIRFWCKVKRKIENRQIKLIKKILHKRSKKNG